MKVEINGHMVGPDDEVVVVLRRRGLRPGRTWAQDEQAAIDFVETVTGYAAHTWTDGTGTMTVQATQIKLPADKPPVPPRPRPAGEFPVGVPTFKERGI